MTWLFLIPVGLLILGILVDSALRRGKLGIGWPIVLVFVIRFLIDNPSFAELEKRRAAAAAGIVTAYCLFGFIVYRVATLRQKAVRGVSKVCRICGRKISLFNRALDVADLCGKCARSHTSR
ncbi:MAG: hypothetical protein NTW93_10420 [Phycisphaerae bacterium]|nr:hypothetical protein [Phycisphaerae bacterium]